MGYEWSGETLQFTVRFYTTSLRFKSLRYEHKQRNCRTITITIKNTEEDFLQRIPFIPILECPHSVRKFPA